MATLNDRLGFNGTFRAIRLCLGDLVVSLSSSASGWCTNRCGARRWRTDSEWAAAARGPVRLEQFAQHNTERQSVAAAGRRRRGLRWRNAAGAATPVPGRLRFVADARTVVAVVGVLRAHHFATLGVSGAVSEQFRGHDSPRWLAYLWTLTFYRRRIMHRLFNFHTLSVLPVSKYFSAFLHWLGIQTVNRASEVTTLWRFTNILFIIIIIFLPSVSMFPREVWKN